MYATQQSEKKNPYFFFVVILCNIDNHKASSEWFVPLESSRFLPFQLQSSEHWSNLLLHVK